MGEFSRGRVLTWASLDVSEIGRGRVWKWASLDVGEFGSDRGFSFERNCMLRRCESETLK